MTRTNSINFHPASENSLLVTWPEQVSPIQHQHITTIETLLKQHFREAIVETVVSYNALIIYYHFDRTTYQSIQHYIECNLAQIKTQQPPEICSEDLISIPVYYGEDAGWDLAEVARRCKMSIDQVIGTHSQASYRSYALGFTPGFCYLASLSPLLALPRRKTPRLNIPQGAVAIAEQQTAIYPCVSPGGWHIIGQTPTAMYHASRDDFTPTLPVGRQVQFTPIDKSEFLALGGNIALEHNSDTRACT